MPHDMLAVFQRPGIAAARCSGASFLEFIIGRVREAQRHVFELFAELIGFSQQLERAAFGRRWRIDHEVAVTSKHSPSNLAVYWRNKADRARAQVERPGIALELEIADADRFSTQPNIAQRLVRRVGIRARGGVLRARKSAIERDDCKNQSCQSGNSAG